MITEIKQLIKDANNTTVISALIDINMKISGYLVYFAEQESEALRKKLVAYNLRKEFEANYIITSDEGVTKAEKYAVVKSKDLRDNEIATEVEYQAARSFRSQVNELVQALTQKIAHLRREAETSKYQQG